MDRFALDKEDMKKCDNCGYEALEGEFYDDNGPQCPRDDEHPVCPHCEHCLVCNQDVDMIEWDMDEDNWEDD